jgi:hypothetical protein
MNREIHSRISVDRSSRFVEEKNKTTIKKRGNNNSCVIVEPNCPHSSFDEPPHFTPTLIPIIALSRWSPSQVYHDKGGKADRLGWEVTWSAMLEEHHHNSLPLSWWF